MIARLLHRARLLARGLFHRTARERELECELHEHLERLIEENRAAGMSPEEARLAALREFGGMEQYREACRDTWVPVFLADLGRDLRFAAKSLGRTPGFTAIALTTLALGIGANTSMYSLVRTAMLKPLPYPASDQLDQIHRASPQDAQGLISAADYLDLSRETAGHYGEVTAFAYGDVSVAPPGEPADFAQSIRVSGNFFSLLGIAPQLGRDFLPVEDAPGRDAVVVISRRCWVNRFGGAPDIIGTTVRIDGVTHEIVGVLPEAFNEWRHLGWVDIFRPLALSDEEAADRATPRLRLLGRRSAEFSSEEAGRFIVAFGDRLAREHPAIHAADTLYTVPLDDVKMGTTGGVAAGMLIGLSAFVLLIACSNLANLLLARTMARAREFALRGALGASRTQLLRPLVVESLARAFGGALLAMVVAFWTTDWLRVRSTGDNGEQVQFTLDASVFAWALGAALVTALAFGLAPALFALRLDTSHTLKSGGRGTTGGRGQRRLRHLLIVGQFALALVLLAGAGLLVRGIDDLNNHRAGWESDDLVTGTILLPESRYPDDAAITTFHRLALERLAAQPGAASAALAHYLPFLTWYDPVRYVIDGRDRPEPGREPAALVNGISPAYLGTVGTRLLAGREFDGRDSAAAPAVALVSESMARDLFGNDPPIGRRIAEARDGTLAWIEIVGVVADVRSIFPDPTPVTWRVYRPITQLPGRRIEIAVRTDGVSAASMVASVRTALDALDPDLPVRDLKAANDRISRANYQLAVLRDVLAWFAILGLGLAAMGIYGVVARLTALRTGEFGVRLALGAQVGDIARLVLANGAKLALLGAALGLIGAIGLSRMILATFPGMDLAPEIVLGGSTALLVGVALLACLAPARQAARISPTEALRAD